MPLSSASLHFSQLCVAFTVKYWLQFVCSMKFCVVLCLVSLRCPMSGYMSIGD